MRRRSIHNLLAGTLALVAIPSLTGAPARATVRAPEPVVAAAGVAAAAKQPNVVVRWNDAGLTAVIRNGMGAPLIARAMAVLHTCIYDAWAAYDPVAVGTRYGPGLRQPAAQQTRANKKEALSYAAYTAAVDLWPESKPQFNALMADLGYPKKGTTQASAIGVRACKAVLAFRHNDGADQMGDMSSAVAYSDYTGYQAMNDPMVVKKPLKPKTVKDPNRWQPLVYTDQKGQTKPQTYLAPHWYQVQPFALTSWNEFKPTVKPARYGSKRYEDQAKEIVDLNGNLSPRRKAIAEYWADGPGTPQPPGHWSKIGQYVSQRDNHNIDQDAKMFFALTNAIFDAGIECWGFKRKYDSVRPITAIRYLYRNKQIPSWPVAGASKGTMIDGADWIPYQPTWFPTPPFSEFPSGHSTFSAAAAEVLRSFTGSDTYGASATMEPGTSKAEPGVAPKKPITLSWKTFSAAADQSGISRRYGGIHFEDGDLQGRAMGQKIGAKAWRKANKYFAGTIGATG